LTFRLAFISGSRSEYGIAKALLFALEADIGFDLEIIPTGIHLLHKYGYTVDEIIADGFYICDMVPTYIESGEPKAIEFGRTFERMSSLLARKKPHAVLLIGDRIEPYASALAAHFLGIPILHIGGGHITKGAVDNIYRYNISNLASLHFTTTKNTYERLCSTPVVDNTTVYFIGSVAIDAIMEFKKVPKPISTIVKGLIPGQFALMTFHPVTATQEPIQEIMQVAIDQILKSGFAILLTYPNNDLGSEFILEVISENRKRAGIFVKPSLGSKDYHAALNDCSFVIGNSSSGLTEAPYFNKPVLNIGVRQDGRDKDEGVTDVEPISKAVKEILASGFEACWPMVSCNNLYGTGQSVKKFINVLTKLKNNL
jgi:UDP-hydrolysing UDP-N-acetyl-D-glucosamine 2-epimerase